MASSALGQKAFCPGSRDLCGRRSLPADGVRGVCLKWISHLKPLLLPPHAISKSLTTATPNAQLEHPGKSVFVNAWAQGLGRLPWRRLGIFRWCL